MEGFRQAPLGRRQWIIARSQLNKWTNNSQLFWASTDLALCPALCTVILYCKTILFVFPTLLFPKIARAFEIYKFTIRTLFKSCFFFAVLMEGFTQAPLGRGQWIIARSESNNFKKKKQFTIVLSKRRPSIVSCTVYCSYWKTILIAFPSPVSKTCSCF